MMRLMIDDDENDEDGAMMIMRMVLPRVMVKLTLMQASSEVVVAAGSELLYRKT